MSELQTAALLVGLGGAALVWLTKYLIPQLFKRFDGALEAFRVELAHERRFHERQVDDLRADIRQLAVAVEKGAEKSAKGRASRAS